MAEAFDLAILGAGPAGAACALRASARGLRVAIFDPQAGGFDKACGEGLMPDGAAALREFGLSDRNARPFPGLRYVVPGAGRLEIPFTTPGEAWWRSDLHAALAERMAAEPAIVRVTARAEAIASAAGFTLRAAAGCWQARCLAVADGAGGSAASWLRRSAPNSRPRRLGARQRFAERGRLDRVEIHFGRGCDVYLTPLPRGAINAVVLSDVGAAGAPDAAELLGRGLAAHPEAARCLGVPLGRAEARPLGRPWPRRNCGGGAFLIGDAGGALDPILGAGLVAALRTGCHAADAAAALAAGAALAAVEREFLRADARERRARRMLAAMLLGLSRHDLAARLAVRGLRAAPALARLLAGIAAQGSGRRRAGAPSVPRAEARA